MAGPEWEGQRGKTIKVRRRTEPPAQPETTTD